MRTSYFCFQLLTLTFVGLAPFTASSAEMPSGLFFSIGGINGQESDGKLREAEFGSIAISQDGRNWETVFKAGMVKDGFSHANNNLIRGITYGKGRYVAVGNPGIGILVSEDGRTWKHVTKYKDGYDGFNVCFGNGVFLVARAGELIRSEDGLTWTKHRTPFEGKRTFGEGGLGHMRQVVFGNGLFVCLGDNRIAVTHDGKSYDHVLFHSENGSTGRQSIHFGGGHFLWLRTTGHQISTDGVTWKPLVIGDDDADQTRTGQAISTVWTGDRFLTGGKAQFFESPDGTHWTKIQSKGYFRPEAAGNGVILGKGSLSPDGGKTWTKAEAGVPQRQIVFLPNTETKPGEH